MGKSVSKIRHIQEANEKLEEKFLTENKIVITERMGNPFNNIWARAASFGSRFATFGRNFGALFGGGTAENPKLNAAIQRVKTRSNGLYNALSDYEKDLAGLFSDEVRAEIEAKIQKKTEKDRDPAFVKQMTDKYNTIETFTEEMIKHTQALKKLIEGING